jgi:hypothetical protein
MGKKGASPEDAGEGGGGGGEAYTGAVGARPAVNDKSKVGGGGGGVFDNPAFRLLLLNVYLCQVSRVSFGTY